MAKRLGSLFFTTLKRVARMQRQALKLVSSPAVKPRLKSAKKIALKKAAAKKTAAKRKPAARHETGAAVNPVPPGKGTWQSFVHLTAPSATELLGRLAYSLYRPHGRPIAGMPLLIMLHGCQQTPYEMALGSRMNKLADTQEFAVVYPQQTKRVQAMRCWRWFEPDARHGLAEADAIADLARAMVLKYRLDATRVYVAGLSAGAGMAGLVALRHPDVFAAVAMHSGAVLGAAHNAATGLRTMRQGSATDPTDLIRPFVQNSKRFPGLPAMILHGKRDHVVSARNAAQLTNQFAAINGVTVPKETVLAQGTHREYVRQDFLKGGRVTVRACLLKEVGHAWSGGDSKLKFHSKEGPRASLLIWQFLSMHSR